jgi:hypothetical protein
MHGARVTPAYDRWRGRLQTGDLILFSGAGLVSTVIRCCTRSRWSHIGMVLRAAEWDAVLLWESTALTRLRDLRRGVVCRGVQLVSLSERVRRYQGGVALRRLEARRTAPMLARLAQLRRAVRDRPYEHDIRELLRAAYDGPWGDNEEDLSSLFCSELVAEAYQAMGLLPDSRPSNEYTPRDFSSETPTPLPLRPGATLTPEIPLKP